MMRLMFIYEWKKSYIEKQLPVMYNDLIRDLQDVEGLQGHR